MLHLLRGTVKFFLLEKGWGFITPDDGTPEVWFHVQYYSGLSEFYSGELEAKFADDSTLAGEYHAPKKGEPILYEPYKSERGLLAVHWLFPETLEQAEKIISERPNDRANYPVRVTRFGSEEKLTNTFMPTIIWEGTYNEFVKKLDEGFPEMHDDDHSYDALEINGEWQRKWHPKGWHPKYKT